MQFQLFLCATPNELRLDYVRNKPPCEQLVRRLKWIQNTAKSTKWGEVGVDNICKQEALIASQNCKRHSTGFKTKVSLQ